jgi:hypothetical protein
MTTQHPLPRLLAASLASLALSGCWLDDPGSGNPASDALVTRDVHASPDAAGLDDAQVTPDASTPGGGTIGIYLTGDLTPREFTDGLSGQTPSSYLIALSQFYTLTGMNDPAPALCFDHGDTPVVADLYADTLMGSCPTAAVPTAVYLAGKVKVDWVQHTVDGVLHYQGMSLPGQFTFFRAYSDTEVAGEPYLAGEGWVRFSGAVEQQLALTYEPLPQLPGLIQETVDGEYWLTFPYQRPLEVVQDDPGTHWSRMHWEIYEAFRWQEQGLEDYADGTWDVAPTVADTEVVVNAGVTGYHITASTDE